MTVYRYTTHDNFTIPPWQHSIVPLMVRRKR
jgi:hypothetical protein